MFHLSSIHPQVRLQIKEEREEAQRVATAGELQAQALRNEIENITDTLRSVRRELSVDRAALIKQKGKTSQAVRSLRIHQEEHAEATSAWRREETAKITALIALKQQELADMDRVASNREAALAKVHAEDIERLKANAVAETTLALSKAETRHATVVQDMAQRFDARLHVEKDKLERKLGEARNLAARHLSDHVNAKENNGTLSAALVQLEKDKQAKIIALRGEIAKREARVAALEATLSSRVQEFDAEREEAARVADEQHAKLERFREVSLALVAAGKTLKADLMRAEGSVVAWKTQVAKEEARAEAAEALLRQKNQEIRRLRQGFRVQGAAAEEAMGRAAAAENHAAVLRPQLAEARAVAQEAVAHIKDMDSGYVPRPNESFSERLERSLVSASRGVEELADEEHSLWRRDASFGAWVEERRGGNSRNNHGGKENRLNALQLRQQQKKHEKEKRVVAAAELEKVEHRLMVLQARANDRVLAVSSMPSQKSGGSEDSSWI